MVGQTTPGALRYTDVPYVPTPQKLVDTMLAIAGVKQGDVLMDLAQGMAGLSHGGKAIRDTGDRN